MLANITLKRLKLLNFSIVIFVKKKKKKEDLFCSKLIQRDMIKFLFLNSKYLKIVKKK